MKVRLIAITQPVISECTDMIAYCARVSNPSNQANSQTAPKLLNYLVRNAHWSPFEMASMTVEIVTTRAIAHQIIRHRSFSFQEFSQRYSAVQAETVFGDARMQDVKNRQSSLVCDNECLNEWWQHQQKAVSDLASTAYQKALDKGIAKEVARNLLPEGLTLTTIYMAGTIRSFIHYCQIRCHPSTQKEHREVALEVRGILLGQFPALVEVLIEGSEFKTDGSM